MHFTRYEMYKSIFSVLKLPLCGDILGISGLKYWVGSKNYKPPQKIIDDGARITHADYPQVNILQLPYTANSFDFVICDQVLEHIEGNIEKAVSEIHRVLRPGGKAIIATVFMNPIHYGPKDMWRFSPDALKYLCKDFSRVVTCDGWGNRFAHALFLLYPRSRDWQIPERTFSIKHYLATKNDPLYPQATWIIAEK